MSQKLCPLTLEELGQNNATECGSAQMMHSMVDKHKDLLPRVEEVVDKEDEHFPGNLAQDIRKSVSTPMEARSQEACQVSSMPYANGFSHPSKTSQQMLDPDGANQGLRSGSFSVAASEVTGLVEQIREKRKAEEVIQEAGFGWDLQDAHIKFYYC